MACIGCAGSNTGNGSTSGATDKDKARALEDQGISFIRQGNLRAALEKLLEAEKLDPENPYLKHEVGQVYRDLGDYQKALEYFQQALILKPRFPEVQNHLGALYILLREWDLAIEYCQKAASDLLYKSPHFAYTNLGLAYYYKGKYDMAVISFQQALKLAPEYSPAFFGLGYTYEEINKWDWAIEAYKKSIFYDPNKAEAFFRMGRLLLKMDHRTEAREALGQFLELVPEGPEAGEARRLLETIPP